MKFNGKMLILGVVSLHAAQFPLYESSLNCPCNSFFSLVENFDLAKG